MADVALIITSSIFGLLIIIGAVYYVVYFQQPDDKMVAWMPKLVVVCYQLFQNIMISSLLLQVIGMSLACYNIFLLPLDIANQNNSFIATGGLDMALMEFIFFISSIVVALAVTPFAMYYYEGMDERDE